MPKIMRREMQEPPYPSDTTGQNEARRRVFEFYDRSLRAALKGVLANPNMTPSGTDPVIYAENTARTLTERRFSVILRLPGDPNGKEA